MDSPLMNEATNANGPTGRRSCTLGGGLSRQNDLVVQLCYFLSVDIQLDANLHT
jgi:hypothetical protein